MGGVPDLPPFLPWPTWTPTEESASNIEERPLDFIAQLNLKELHEFPACTRLPAEGMLYFFYDRDIGPWGDPEAVSGYRVIFYERGNDPLTRRTNPNPDFDSDSHPCKTLFFSEWTIPDWRHYDFCDEYQDGYEPLRMLREELATKPKDEPRLNHRILGWPEEIDQDYQLESQLVANGICARKGYGDPRVNKLRSGAKDWMLLLQIDSDEENPGWLWGDGGTIYYVIHRNDLANRRFDRVQVVNQCY
jgi:uncharacterized protein YwqG